MILVVDDDNATRGLIEQRLRHRGFPTVSAASSVQALEILHDGAKPCLILLEVMSPGEVGWAFVEQLLKSPVLSDIPVALLSASPSAAEAPRWPSRENAALFAKPLDVKKLVALAALHCRCRLPAAQLE